MCKIAYWNHFTNLAFNIHENYLIFYPVLLTLIFCMFVTVTHDTDFFLGVTRYKKVGSGKTASISPLPGMRNSCTPPGIFNTTSSWFNIFSLVVIFWKLSNKNEDGSNTGKFVTCKSRKIGKR